MLIYEALQKDHVKVQALIEELIEAGETGERRRAKLLVEEVRDELIPHSRAEEAVFYTVLGASGEETQPLVLHHGFQEHIEAENILRTLLAKKELDAEWKLLARKFQKTVEMHILEEEGEIFTAARKVISDIDAEMIGSAFEKLKPQVQKEGLMKDAIDLVVHMMPAKYAATLRTVSLKPDTILQHLY